jgi:flagellar protein FlaG
MNIDIVKEATLPQGTTAVRKPRAERVPAADAPATPPQPAAGAAEVDAAIEAANHSMRSVATNLKFEKDTTTGKTVVRVIDSETQQILRQMPSEEMLAMSKALDRLQGLMVHLKV